MFTVSIATIYFPLAFLMGALGLFAGNKTNDIPEIRSVSKNEFNDRRGRFVVVLINIILILFSAFRKITANSVDEWAYRRRFNYYDGLSLKEVFSDTSEYLFNGIVWLSTRIFSTDQGIIIITGTITVLLLLYAVRKYCLDYSFGIMALMLTGTVFFTFNGIQQCMAAALFLAGVKYIYSRDFKKFLIIVILCTLIHNSSVILIVFYFVGNVRFKSLKFWIYSLTFLIGIIIVYRYLPTLMFNVGLFTEYQDKILSGHHGVNVIRILLNVVPIIIPMLLSTEIFEKDYKLNTIANISMMNAVIYLASSMDVYIARFALFTSPFYVLLLDNLLPYFSSGKSKLLYKFVVIGIYCAFFIIEAMGTKYTFNLIF